MNRLLFAVDCVGQRVRVENGIVVVVGMIDVVGQQVEAAADELSKPLSARISLHVHAAASLQLP